MFLDLVSPNRIDGPLNYDNIFEYGEQDSVPIRIPLESREYEGQDVWIEIVRSPAKRDVACELINRMYSWRGYGNAHHLSERPSHTTFTVEAGGDVIGTVTLAADSRHGLAVDTLFRSDINAARNRAGAHVCELTKLAFDAKAESKHLLAALFHVVFLYGVWRHHGTDLFIEVNPRHRRFYEAMLGFKRIGDLRTNESVNAPSQLMWLRVADIDERIEQGRSASGANCRSLYPQFLTGQEEADVCSHLWSAIVGAGLQEATMSELQEQAGSLATLPAASGYDLPHLTQLAAR